MRVLSVVSGVTAFALVSVGAVVAPSSAASASASTPAAVVASVSPEVWEPDVEVEEPDPGGPPPSRPWTPGGGQDGQVLEGSGVEEEGVEPLSAASAEATAGFSAPAGIGDRSGYSFEEFQLTSDPGYETVKVNVGSGNLFVRSRMVELAGPGVAAVAYQVHNSLHNPHVGSLSSPWFTDVEMTGLVIDSGSVVYYDGTGVEWEFTQSGSSWVAPQGLNASLTQLGNGTWRVTYNRTGERVLFNSYGWATGRQDRNGVGITYGWTSIGFLVSITDAVGKQVSVTRTTNGQLASLSAAGRSTTFDYTPDYSRLESVDAGGGRVSDYTYQSGRVATITNAGRTQSFVYDSAGRVTKVTLSRSGETSQVTSFAYTGNTTTVTDPRGNTVVYELDSQDRVVKVTDQRGRTRSQAWTANSDVASTTDGFSTGGGQGNETSTTYDSLNNPTGIVLPTGATTQAVYAQGTDCQNAQSGHPYLPKCTIDASGNRGSYTYDSAGNLTKVTDTTASGTGATFSYTYEVAAGTRCGGEAGQVCSATDGNGKVTSYSYTNGNLTTVTPPGPLGPTTNVYDAVGRVTQVTDGNGDTTTYAYDAADRVTKITFDNGQSLVSVYNDDGTLASETDSAGGSITYAYNLLGKQTQQAVQAPSGAGISGTVTMGYDASGNLTSYDDGTGTTQYDYDTANQLIRMIEPGGTCPAIGYPPAGSGCTKFAYDLNGAEITRIFPGAARLDINRDAAGRMTRLRARDAGGAMRANISYGYTSGGTDRTLLQTRTSTLEQGIPAGAVTTYTYDSLQRLTRAQEKAGSTVNATFAYTYDKAGNRTSQTQTGSLGAADGGTTNYTYNAANQIASTTADTATWAYDQAGNETRSGLRGWTNTYGDRGQLTGLASRTYATFGQGNQRTLRAGTVNYLLSPLGVTREINGTNTTRTARTPDGRVLGATRNTPEYYATDHLGSVVGLFNDNGAWIGGYSYTPYGERRFGGPGTANNNWRYIGGDEELASFYNLNARYYDALTGRFTQMDPTGQETNPYTYAQANPCNLGDPTGTLTCAESVVLGVAAIGALALVGHAFAGLLTLSAAQAAGAAALGQGVNAVLSAQLAAFGGVHALGGFVNECL